MKYFFTGIILLITISCFAQSVYVPLNQDYYHLLDRYEVLNGNITPAFFTSVKPIERREIAEFLDSLSIDSSRLSSADRFNIRYLSNDNWEWTNSPYKESRKPFLKHFYQKKSDFYSVHTKEFDFHINPVIYWQLGHETATSDLKYINSRGIEFRGNIDNKIGFYFFAADNQAAFPSYVNNFVHNFDAIPNQGFYKTFKKNGYDFFTSRGYITFSVTKYIHFQFGRDQNFIGNGYRSLILSDFSSPYTFLKINTKIWKFNYMNLFTEMNAGVSYTGNTIYPKKYMALHHLSLNLTKNLNVGIFESEVFGRSDSTKNGQFDISYLNPIIFYRDVESQLGSGDNALLGMDLKWNFLKHFSFYGQVVLDEFLLKEVKAGKGWWSNKQAGQVGLKYMNAFGIKNLDLQGEVNIIRPYTYQHASLYTSYTHYNQPLAHPLGANLYELVGVARYQPTGRLTLIGKLFFDRTGLDSNYNYKTLNAIDNFGGNPLKSYLNVPTYHNYGNKIGNGIKTDIIYLSFTATYQVKHNFFIDLNAIYRKSTSAYQPYNYNTAFANVALRWNIAKRLQEF